MLRFVAICCSVVQREYSLVHSYQGVQGNDFIYSALQCCSVLQRECVAVRCSVLQCVAVRCSMRIFLRTLIKECREMNLSTVRCSVAVCCSVLQCVAA